MDCLCHIAYRLDSKTHRRDTPRKKDLSALKKKAIQDAFKAEMGLLIDVPKSGSGTTTDGNTCRRFFQNPSKTADILKIDEDLVRRLSVILQTLNSGFDIDCKAFREYCPRSLKGMEQRLSLPV